MLCVGMKGFGLTFDDEGSEPRGGLAVYLEAAGDCGALAGETRTG